MRNETNRRTFQGLVVDRSTQLKLAVSCTSLVLVPSLIVSTMLIVDLAVQAGRLSQSPVTAGELAQQLVPIAIKYSVGNAILFSLLALCSIFVSLKISGTIIGPVKRLEKFVDGLSRGEYQVRTNLRKGDYLSKLGESLDNLAANLEQKKP